MRKRLKNHFVPHKGNQYKPHLVRGKSITTLAIFALAVFGFAFSIKSVITKHPDLLSSVITGVLVDLTNTSRLSENLNPLEFSPVLASAAQLKANDMAEKEYFAHTSPENKSPWYWFAKGGYEFVYAGENLAVNFVDSEDVVEAWLNSPSHRANILNSKFTEIGIAMAPGKHKGRDTIYVVQLFGQPAPLDATASPVISEQISQPAETGSSNSSVSGATAEAIDLEVLHESETFIAVQNNTHALQAEVQGSYETQTSAIDQLATSPKYVLKFIYIAMGAVMFIALILLAFIHPGKRHKKNIFYTLLLLALLSVLLYLGTNHLFPPTTVV